MMDDIIDELEDDATDCTSQLLGEIKGKMKKIGELKDGPWAMPNDPDGDDKDDRAIDSDDLKATAGEIEDAVESGCVATSSKLDEIFDRQKELIDEWLEGEKGPGKGKYPEWYIDHMWDNYMHFPQSEPVEQNTLIGIYSK